MDFLILNEKDKNNLKLSNSILNLNNLKDYNIIENDNIVNKPEYSLTEEKLIIYKKKINISNSDSDRVDFDFKFKFTTPQKDVVSVKLLKASLKINRDNIYNTGNFDDVNGTIGSSATSFNYYILNIDELNNTKSSNQESLNLDSIPSGKLNNLNDSFAVLDLNTTFDNDDTNIVGTSLDDYSHFYNFYHQSECIKYFDPPISNLSEFNIKLYPHNYNTIASRGSDTYLLLEFLIKKL